MPTPRAGETASSSMPAMSVNARTTRFVGLVACLGLVVLLLGVMPVASQAPPQRVTSDTPEYCLRLQDRVSEMVRVASAPPPHEVTSLSTEGQRMCDQGQTRGGILRLRRALLMMMHQGEQP